MRGTSPTVVMPYTQAGQFPEAEAAAEVGHDLLKVNVGGNDEAYWDLLHGLWAKQQTFVVVEHDIVVTPDAVDELLACQRPWCSFAYTYAGTQYAGLGCAKFEAKLMTAHPDVFDIVATMSDEGHNQKHWCRLDGWSQNVLRDTYGEELHVHIGGLVHIRRSGESVPMPSHGCWR